MATLKNRVGLLLAGLAASVWCSGAAAAMVTYTIDPSQSELTASGSALNGAVVLLPQAPGSLTTSYNGTINADLSAATFQFLGGALDADVSGNHIPGPGGVGGPAPGDYGGYFDAGIMGRVDGAVRDLTVEITSGLLTRTGPALVGGTSIAPTNGVIDYVGSGAQAGLFGSQPIPTLAVANMAGSDPALTNDGLTETLMVPVEASVVVPLGGPGAMLGTMTSLPALDATITLTGTIVATRLVPEPATLIMLAAGGSVRCLRRRK